MAEYRSATPLGKAMEKRLRPICCPIYCLMAPIILLGMPCGFLIGSYKYPLRATSKGHPRVQARTEEELLVWCNYIGAVCGNRTESFLVALSSWFTLDQSELVPTIFPPADHAEGGDENQPHTSAHNSTSTANQDVVAAQLTAMQQQFGVFQLVLVQLLARNNPGDPLINLLNPAQQPPAPQQNPQPIPPAPAISESQVAEHRGAPPPHHAVDSIPHPLNTNITLEPYPIGFKIPQLETYDGTKDPDDHLHAFYSCMQAQNASDALMCKIFPSTLRVITPHNDPLVTSVMINNCEVQRVLVDTGSAPDIMYFHCFESLGLDPALLQKYDGPIYGFNNQPVPVEGVLTLHVAFGSGRTYVTLSVRFLVVKMASSFNIVIGRPTLTEIRAVVSQSHLCMKFPTPMGIATLRGNQEVARHCYITSVTQPMKGKAQTPEAIPQRISDNQQVMGVEIVDNRPKDETRAAPVEDVEEVLIDDRDPSRKMQIGIRLNPEERAELIAFLRANNDVFAWTSADMPGIPNSVSQHKLSTNPLKKPVAQKRRLFGGERLQAIKEEVMKLLQVGFIRKVDYCEWVANLVLVKKENGKWRMCIDYTNLNHACPKDCYPMPSINKLVEAASGNERLSLLDAYSGYHQVPMAPEDKEKTAFYAGDEIYCYVMMTFGLKNAGATYQKMVTIVFHAQIGKNLKVYVDDIMVKSLKAEDHLADLDETFNNLKKNRMRLNPAKCIFGVESEKFLGFMVSQRGIEVNPEKIKAIAEMEPPKSVKDIQSSSPLLTKAIDGELLYLYLGISNEAISSVLVREEARQQKPIYYISSMLHGAELRYPIVEKAALAVVTSARKLRPYFQSHPIIVLTDQPLRQILQKPECSGRLIKWAVELGEFEITFQQRLAIRAQALVDFIVECTPCPSNSNPEPNDWTLYVDGASSSKGSRAGALLHGPEGYRSEHALKFNFDATNNIAEYEALLLGLQLALQLQISVIQVYSDSQLVVNQINSICEVVDPVMADLLSKFAFDSSLSSRSVFVEVLYEPSFMKPRMMEISTNPDTLSWTNSIISFLRDGIIPEDRQEAMKLRKKASRYTLVDGILYKRFFSLPLLRCLNPCEAEYALREWVEARPLSSLTSKKVEDFVFSSIICRYGIPNQIVANNGTQFNCSSFRDFCSSYGIKVQFTSVYHPESNGMVESVNKCILEGIRPRLEQHKAKWADELNNVLWAYRTTSRTATVMYLLLIYLK
ncbi:hypothetical protein SLEP1_g26207 [Rubroshorea leprosula]|uniref:RNA-directed DNA polymerase n=1 Tax=Rubroshorea leprosula TaxID=152421 RepID=A0AAV5JLE3_9ROSI|nr:hypothetical protein SLEP1_g26207 [Rubroshorea leprosula]